MRCLANAASTNSLQFMTLCMAGCFGLVQVLQSKPEHLVDTFMLLMPASSQNMNEFVRVCDMKVGQWGSVDCQPVRLPVYSLPGSH
jgi:hypothetical protein